MALAYEKDPARIYRQSFQAIRREVDLGGLSDAEAKIVTRVVHACGMTDVAHDIVFNGDVAGAARGAVESGRPIFTDVEMVRAAVCGPLRPHGREARCLLNSPETRERARRLGTTRSAAGVIGWGDAVADAVVIIGNAPTALFALLDMIDAGGPRPAAIFAFPVGFVGAVESKAELADRPRGLNFVTLGGRRGGSAMAAAAFNAVLIGADAG